MRKSIQLSITAIGFLLLWELLVKFFDMPKYLLPGPWQIILELKKSFNLLAGHAAYTTVEIILGFLLGFLIAASLVILSVYSRYINNVLGTFFSVLQMVPKVAFAPLFLIWIGYGLAPKIIIAAAMCIFPIALNFKKGLDSADQKLIDVARSIGCSKTQVLKNIQIPFALPFLFSGLKLGMSLAVIGAVIAEFVGASRGLGYQIMHSSVFLETPRMFAALFMVIAVGIILNVLIYFLEKKIVFWVKKPVLE